MIEGDLRQTLECALAVLDRLSVPYHVTGGFPLCQDDCRP